MPVARFDLQSRPTDFHEKQTISHTLSARGRQRCGDMANRAQECQELLFTPDAV